MRTYADVSHFRAPFKNWPYLGMGAEAASPSTALDPATVIDSSDGVRSFKPVVADQILKMLATMSVIFIDNNNVKLDARSQGDIRESADSWVKKKTGEGMTVVAGTTGGAHLFGLPLAVDRYLSAVKGHDAEVAATAGAAPLGAVLARPTSLAGMFGKLGPVGMAAVALLAVGGVVWWSKRRKRHSAS